MKKLSKIYFILVFGLSQSIWAATLSVDLSDSSIYSSGDLIHNLQNQTIHPPYYSDSITDLNGESGSWNYTIGTAKNGAFNSSTYSTFSENNDTSGNIITINTDTYSSLNFSSFTLDSGWTLKGKGSNPLKIYVQADVNISGTIDCSGGAGSDASTTLTSSVNGGTGICAGGNGGYGGFNDGGTIVGEAGTNGGASVTGGNSTGVTAGTGGGGGGGYSQGTVASNGTGAAGNAGTSFPSASFILAEEGAGSGGSGGTADTTGSPSTGGGGGAGGGMILITAGGNITINASGSILANGGNGGNSAADGGGGGAGAGGVIILIANSSFINNGTISATGGTGGTSTGGGNGGIGAQGNFYATDSDASLSGSGTENPGNLYLAQGNVRSQTGSFSLSTSIVDSQNSFPEYSTLNITNTGTGSITGTDIATGSSSSFTPSYADISTLTTSDFLRYFTLKITVNSTSNTDPVTISAASVNYTPFEEDEFDFTSSCGLLQNSNNTPNTNYILFLFLPLILLLSLKIILKTKRI